MFEGFVVQLLQHCANTQAVATLLGLNWHAVDQIMRRAVARGMKRRTTETIEHIGLDEKSFRADTSISPHSMTLMKAVSLRSLKPAQLKPQNGC